jgi:hypothetical protein
MSPCPVHLSFTPVKRARLAPSPDDRVQRDEFTRHHDNLWLDEAGPSMRVGP